MLKPSSQPLNSPNACHEDHEDQCARNLTYMPSFNPPEKLTGAVTSSPLCKVRTEVQRAGSLVGVQIIYIRASIGAQVLTHLLPKALSFNYVKVKFEGSDLFWRSTHHIVINSTAIIRAPFLSHSSLPLPTSQCWGLTNGKDEISALNGVHKGRNAKWRKLSHIIIESSLLDFA